MAMLWDFVEDDIDDSAVWDGVPSPIDLGVRLDSEDPQGLIFWR
jgi:hypothetical protein